MLRPPHGASPAARPCLCATSAGIWSTPCGAQGACLCPGARRKHGTRMVPSGWGAQHLRLVVPPVDQQRGAAAARRCAQHAVPQAALKQRQLPPHRPHERTAQPPHMSALALVQRRASGTARRRPAGGHLRHGGARRVVKALVHHDRRPCAPSWGSVRQHTCWQASTAAEHARLGGQLRRRRRGRPLLPAAGAPCCAGRGSAARPCQSGTPGPCPPRRSGRRTAGFKRLPDTCQAACRRVSKPGRRAPVPSTRRRTRWAAADASARRAAGRTPRAPPLCSHRPPPAALVVSRSSGRRQARQRAARLRPHPSLCGTRGPGSWSYAVTQWRCDTSAR